jgi:alanine transaminase
LNFTTKKVCYYLDEDNNWSLSIDELERAYQESLKICQPRAIFVNNPGNPTGQVLSLENMQQIIKWIYEKKLLLISDEVCFILEF